MNLEEYNKNPKICKHCNAVIQYKQRYNIFCNRACSSKFNSACHKRKSKKSENILVDEKAKFDIESYKKLYLNVVGLCGIYLQEKLINKRIILVVKLSNGKYQTRSYPRAIYELYLGRVLDFPNETVDHIDSNPLNNDISNLQLLSLSENAKKAHKDGVACKPPKGTKIPHDPKGESNGMSKISAEDVLKFRRLYTNGMSKNDIIAQLNLNRKTIDNFLFGRTYTNVPEICVSKKYKRT